MHKSPLQSGLLCYIFCRSVAIFAKCLYNSRLIGIAKDACHERTSCGNPCGLPAQNNSSRSHGDHPAHTDLFCPGAGHRGGHGADPVCPRPGAGADRPVLCLVHPGHAGVGSAVCGVLRAAQRGHSHRSLPGGGALLLHQRGRLLQREHPCRAGIGAFRPDGGRLLRGDDLPANHAPYCSAAGHAHRLPAAVQLPHRAGQGHLPGRQHYGDRDVHGHPAHRLAGV